MDISSLFTTTQCFATSPRTLQVPFHLFRSQIYTSLRFSNSLFFKFSSSFSTIVFENVTDSVTNITTDSPWACEEGNLYDDDACELQIKYGHQKSSVINFFINDSKNTYLDAFQLNLTFLIS